MLLNAPLSVIPATPVASEPGLPPCLIVNPKSFRASRSGLAARAAAMATAYGAEVIQSHLPAEIADGLDRLLAEGPRQLFVLSGDGTVQALMDYLVARPAGTELPTLLVLGGGRTNLTAADLGGSGDVLNKLEAALSCWRSGGALPSQIRPLLVLEQAPETPRHGFFVAGGLIDEAIRACHEHRDNGRGALRKGHLSTAWYLLKLAVLALFGRSPLKSPQMNIDAPGLGRLHGPTRVLIATTLLHREGLFNPYAARGLGPVGVTAVAASAPCFWRSLPRILLGRFTERLSLERGYLSGRCDQLTVVGMRGYSLDGEEFDTDPARPIVIRSGPSIRFLKP